MKNIYKYLKGNISYYLIYLFFIIEVIVYIRLKSLGQDESFTFHIIQHNFIDIMKLTAQDVHPFLYYFIAKIFTYDIQNIFIKIFILRLISILPYLILLIIGNSYIKNNFSKLTSKLFMFCIISMPLLSDNIYIIRMYGWATLFTTIVYLLFLSTYKNNNIKIFLLISLFSVLSAYTHYYALIVVTILYLLFLILFIINKMQIKYLMLSIIIDVILYLPWLGILLKQTKNVSDNFWTSKINIEDIVLAMGGNLSPVRHFSIFYILPIILFTILIVISINKGIDNTSIIGLVTPILLVFIGYIASIIIGHSIIMDRYITLSMGIFWVTISIIIAKFNNKYKILQCLLISIVLITGIISYVKTTVYVDKLTNQFNTTLQVFNKISKDSTIIYDNSIIMYDSSNYLNNNYILPKNKISPMFMKAFNNVNENKGLNIPKNYKNVYYLKSDNHNIHDSTFIKSFNDKYKTNNKEQIAKIFLQDGNGILYKIK